MQRFLHDFSRSYQGEHVRVRRQTARNCTTDEECIQNRTLTTVSSNLVRCDNGNCVCSDCFYVDNSDGLCYTCIDYLYNLTTQMCGSDSRQNQLTALLLSIYLSACAAANFYIGQTALGGVPIYKP